MLLPTADSAVLQVGPWSCRAWHLRPSTLCTQLEASRCLTLGAECDAELLLCLRPVVLVSHQICCHCVQAQLDFLWQLQPHLGPVLQGEVSKATAILRDVLAAQQQLVRQEQQGKQGGKAVGYVAQQLGGLSRIRPHQRAASRHDNALHFNLTPISCTPLPASPCAPIVHADRLVPSQTLKALSACIFPPCVAGVLLLTSTTACSISTCSCRAVPPPAAAA